MSRNPYTGRFRAPSARPGSAEQKRLVHSAGELYRTRDDQPVLAADAKPKRERGPRKAGLMATEHAEQVSLIEWWWQFSRVRGLDRRLLFAIPNGAILAMSGDELVRIKRAQHMRSEGVRDGTPDLMLAIARNSYHGMFIEMKRRQRGEVSRDQTEMLQLLSAEHYAAVVCYGWDEARQQIEEYMR